MTKTEILTKMDAMKEQLNELLFEDNKHDAISLWNEFANQNNYHENRIFPMSFLDEYIGCESRPSIILNLIDHDDFNINSDFFWDSIYGIQSGDIDTAIEKSVDKDSLIEFFIEDHEYLIARLNISGDLADWSEEYAELESELEDIEEQRQGA